MVSVRVIEYLREFSEFAFKSFDVYSAVFFICSRVDVMGMCFNGVVCLLFVKYLLWV